MAKLVAKIMTKINAHGCFCIDIIILNDSLSRFHVNVTNRYVGRHHLRLVIRTGQTEPEPVVVICINLAEISTFLC